MIPWPEKNDDYPTSPASPEEMQSKVLPGWTLCAPWPKWPSLLMRTPL